MSTNKPPRGFTTAILHSDRAAGIEHGALHKPLHLSVAYGYRDARDLAAVFQGRAQGYAYGKPEPLDELLKKLDGDESQRLRKLFLEM